MTRLSRRSVIMSGAAALGCAAIGGPILAADPLSITVVKDPDCGCCAAWVDVLDADGFATDVKLAGYDQLQTIKAKLGITPDLASCHTALISGYVIEGHVPPADIRRLLDEAPEAIGLTVPGMPYGSPGMGPEDAREAYDVLIVKRDGSTDVFARYEAAA